MNRCGSRSARVVIVVVGGGGSSCVMGVVVGVVATALPQLPSFPISI